MATRKKDFFRAMYELKNEIFSSKDKEAGVYWMSLKDMLINGNYSSYKKLSTLAEYALYGYNDESLSIKLGISQSTLRVTKMNISNKLYTLFGDDFFDLFKDGFSKNKDELNNRKVLAFLQMSNKNSFETLFPMDIYYMLVNACNESTEEISFELDACIKELSFLSRHCNKQVLKELDGLDKNKLKYLIDIARFERGEPSDRIKIYKEIQ